MFDALRSIGRGREPLHGGGPQQADALSASVEYNGEGLEEWVGVQLRQIQRRQGAARAYIEQQKEDNRDAEAQEGVSNEEGVPGRQGGAKAAPPRLPHRLCSQLAAAYEKPLTALHVASATSLPAPVSSSIHQERGTEDIALGVVADALPSATVWGMAARVWHTAGHTDCPTLRSLAATIMRHDPSTLEDNARQTRQRMPSALRRGASGHIACAMDALAKAAKASNTLHRQTARKRSRDAAEFVKDSVPCRRDHQANVDDAPTIAGDATGEQHVSNAFSSNLSGVPATVPLRSTSSRAQVAASRSRSRTPPPSRSRSQSPPPPPSAGSATIKAASHAVTEGKKSLLGNASTTTATSFSFGVRVAGHPNTSANKGPSTVGAETSAQTSTKDEVHTLPAVPPFSSSSPTATTTTAALRQTTLAAFTAGGGGGGPLHVAPPASSAPQQSSLPPPLQQQQQQQQPSVVAMSMDPAGTSNLSLPKRSSWYNPPSLSGSSKAPPYQYELRGCAGGSDSFDEWPSHRGAAAAAAAPAPSGHHNNNNNNNSASGPSGGFVTAGEQLLADAKQGRTMSSAYLSKRSPALGLRRSGFQPPFRDQQQQGSADAQDNARGLASPPPSATAKVDGNRPGKANSTNNPRAAASGNANGNGNDEEGEGSYPASLLLPDGTVPPILLPLDPKLVTQVAMEILDNGAGARQVGWDDIAGLQHAKASVEEAIVWPLRRPDLFVGLRDPPRGLLLFGPPGTGKTMIARAIANRAGCTFLNISSSSLMSKWMGDGEKLVRCLFAVATVRQPSVIFIDEVDSLLSMRGEGEMDSVRRVKTEFLVQLDGVATDRGDRVLLIGATNRPDELDEAARRRMEKRLYIPLPDEGARRELIQRLLRSLGPGTGGSGDDGSAGGGLTPRPAVHTLTDSDLDSLVRHTHGYSGADLKQLCREAAMGPLREMSVGELSEVSVADLRPIQRRDFKQALKRLKPSVGPAEVGRYAEWNRLFGSFTDQGSESESDDGEDVKTDDHPEKS